MVPLAPTAPRPSGPPTAGPRRADDRRIARISIAIAALFLLFALAAAGASATGNAVPSPWLPIHLALAGGASTAIAGVMPFFVAALAATAPAPARLRAAAVVLVAAGAALVAVRGIVPSAGWAPIAGGLVYLAGIGALALAVRASGRRGLMIRRPIVSLGYTIALGNVAVGALIGTLSVAGWLPVLEAWDRLRAAHAWTNLVGFVSLVIIATLIHLLPTVLGGRIHPRRSAVGAVLGPGAGSPLLVVGIAAAAPPLAIAGAALTLAGAVSLAIEVVRVVRDRGRWTSDHGWHRYASGGLLAGVGWYLAGISSAAWLAIGAGGPAATWSTPIAGPPLAVGWIAQVLTASWTHLVPAIGPGSPPDHARQRAVLGRWATTRLVALNAGVVVLWFGAVGGGPEAVVAGAALAGASVGGSVALLVAALRVTGVRS